MCRVTDAWFKHIYKYTADYDGKPIMTLYVLDEFLTVC